MAEVLQVYAVPRADLPVAPAGAQKAPGETIDSGEGDGVGEAETVGVGGVPTMTVMISDLVLLINPAPARVDSSVASV